MSAPSNKYFCYVDQCYSSNHHDTMLFYRSRNIKHCTSVDTFVFMLERCLQHLSVTLLKYCFVVLTQVFKYQVLVTWPNFHIIFICFLQHVFTFLVCVYFSLLCNDIYAFFTPSQLKHCYILVQ